MPSFSQAFAMARAGWLCSVESGPATTPCAPTSAIRGAHRAGLTDVIIPKRNEPDLDDLPESVRGELRIHPVADVADVLDLALEPAAVASVVA